MIKKLNFSFDKITYLNVPYKINQMDSGNENMNNISKFYDDFSEQQVITGTNLRHYYLFNRILKSGLKKDHKVLEIGCGIGTLTKLLFSFLKKGEMVVTDISENNIKIARERLKSTQRIEFIVSDMQNFSHDKKFDFIILADVMEHIPQELHIQLFQTIVKHMKDDATLFINIPHPKNIEFLKENFQEKLQIIDQALYADSLTKDAAKSGLILKEYKSYSLFHKENDYNIIIFKLNKTVKFNALSKGIIIVKKFFYRLSYYYSTKI